MSNKSDPETMQFNPYYFFKDSFYVSIKSSFFTLNIFDQFLSEKTQVDNF